MGICLGGVVVALVMMGMSMRIADGFVTWFRLEGILGHLGHLEGCIVVLLGHCVSEFIDP